MKKGSVTIFLSLLLPVLIIFVFTLIETSRIEGLRYMARSAGDAAIDSLFAAYNRNLFDTYGLLFFDGGYSRSLPNYEKMETEFSDNLWANLSNGSYFNGGSLFPTDVGKAKVADMVTATDYNGEIFIRAALDYFEYEAIGDVVSAISEIVTLSEKGQEEKTKAEEKKCELKETDWSAHEGEETEEEAADGDSEKLPEVDPELLAENVSESIIGGAEKVNAGGVYNLILCGTPLSGEVLDISDLPSHMKIDTTTLNPEANFFTEEGKKAIFDEYLFSVFSDYTEQKNRNGFQYELEYLLYGNPEDAENVRAAMRELLGIREGINLLYLVTSEKRTEAKALSLAMVGWTGNPLIEELTTASLLAAWAYAEAILDVRELMLGEKVPAVKTNETWNISLKNVATLFSGGAISARKSNEGLSYEDYLRILLFTRDISQSAYRAMDLIQYRLRFVCPEFLMMNQIYALEMKVNFSARELFTLFPLVRGNRLYMYQYEWTQRFTKAY